MLRVSMTLTTVSVGPDVSPVEAHPYIAAGNNVKIVVNPRTGDEQDSTERYLCIIVLKEMCSRHFFLFILHEFLKFITKPYAEPLSVSASVSDCIKQFDVIRNRQL